MDAGSGFATGLQGSELYSFGMRGPREAASLAGVVGAPGDSGDWLASILIL